MILLTEEFAKKHVGEWIGSFEKQNGSQGTWPKQIIRFPSGRLGLKDRNKVCTPIDEVNRFNRTYFDYVCSDLREVTE